MNNKLVEMLHSKKFWAAIVGIAWQVYLTIKPDWDTPAAEQVHTLIMAYILGTAIVDHGKASAAPSVVGSSASTPTVPPRAPTGPGVHDKATVLSVPRSVAVLLLVGAGYAGLVSATTACTPAARQTAAADALEHIDATDAGPSPAYVIPPPTSVAPAASAPDGGTR